MPCWAGARSMCGAGTPRLDAGAQADIVSAETQPMNIANSTGVNTAVRSASGSELGTVRSAASTLVLRKALDMQAPGAIELLNALPAQPSLATEGQLGRHVDTFA